MSGQHVKDRALSLVFGADCKFIEPIKSNGLLAGRDKGRGRPVFVVSGTFGRPEFKRAVAEAEKAGLSSNKILVIGDLCSYTGAGIEFIKNEAPRAEDSAKAA